MQLSPCFFGMDTECSPMEKSLYGIIPHHLYQETAERSIRGLQIGCNASALMYALCMWQQNRFLIQVAGKLQLSVHNMGGAQLQPLTPTPPHPIPHPSLKIAKMFRRSGPH